jgi:hypothetical protein
MDGSDDDEGRGEVGFLRWAVITSGAYVGRLMETVPRCDERTPSQPSRRVRADSMAGWGGRSR